MAHQDKCDTRTALLHADSPARAKLLAVVGDPSIDYFETENDFCELSEMQGYLLRNSYTVHPCEAVKRTQHINKMCGIFMSIAPPPYEVRSSNN